jgi:hypothetical protein
MLRTAIRFVLPLPFVVCALGCAHFIETQAINRFTEALDSDDLLALKSSASNSFEHKALRLTESLDDFKILNLPEGKTTVVNVEESSDDEKRVTVTVGESERRLLYRLTRDSESDKWVVDDIFVKQKKKGLTAAKSVTQQMDLLLSVREFLSAWTQGGSESVLAVTAPDFAQVLKGLHPVYLEWLTRQVVKESPHDSKGRPDAQMDEDVAVVRLPQTGGRIVLSYRLFDGDWKVTDVALESRDDQEHIPSTKKLASIVGTAATFLDAYATGDMPALKSVSSGSFFEASVSHGDLSSVSLPRTDQAADRFSVTMRDRRADFVIEGEAEYTKISLAAVADPNTESPHKYSVAEVTIYELETGQEKRLSALFTANAMMRIFSDSLVKRDLVMLEKTSSADFNRRVWKLVDNTLMQVLPLAEIEPVTPKVLSIVFEGAVTEITVMQGNRALTYVLRDNAGRVRVDDVLMPVVNRPSSLKATLELMLPVYQFANGIATSQLGLLGRNSSNELNRRVWTQVDTVPNPTRRLLTYLQAPLTSITQADDTTLVMLGDNRWGAEVRLTTEHARHVVEDILMIDGPEPKQREHFKQVMRAWLTSETARAVNLSAMRRATKPTETEPIGQQLIPAIVPSDDAFTSPDDEPAAPIHPPSQR